MGVFFTPFFWGLLLIIWGISVVISILFKIDIPIARIVIAFILIYLGIRMLIGWGGFERPNNTAFFGNNEIIKVTALDQEYNVIFGRGLFDLGGAEATNDGKPVKINTIFGAGVIRVNQALPVKIKVNSCFADAVTPDGNHINVGNYIYLSPGFKEEKPYLSIEANVIFGSLAIEK